MNLSRAFIVRAHRGVLCTLAVGALAGALSGCVTRVVEQRPVVVERPAPPRPVVVQQVRHMPAPIREDRGAQPAPDFNWVPGHWKWAGNDWQWVHGNWVRQPVPPMPEVIVETIPVAPAPQAMWVPGHWVWRWNGGGWQWERGHWQR